MDARLPSPQVFRPRLVFGAAMGMAGSLWLAVLIYLMRFEGVPAKTMFSAIFFVVFFAVALAYYTRTAIYVDAGGVTYRGMIRTLRFDYSDIRKVDVLPGPVTVYAIRAQGRFVHFTSFFKHHQRLMALLVDKAGLAPQRKR